ncbi:MAG: hypothetical protein AABX38_04545 [Candidatus Micrarchaeota archaeon]
MTLDLGISEIEKTLMKKEGEFDKIMTKTREVVRNCSNAIKAAHAHDWTVAHTHLKEAEKELKEMRKFENTHSQVNHVMQEYAEAVIIINAIDNKKISTFKEVGVPIESYLTGLLDAVGELKRETLESLRKGKKDDAEIYFKMMEDIYDELLPIRFSNSVLPEFRRKQDSARFQVEQTRAELL